MLHYFEIAHILHMRKWADLEVPDFEISVLFACAIYPIFGAL